MASRLAFETPGRSPASRECGDGRASLTTPRRFPPPWTIEKAKKEDGSDESLTGIDQDRRWSRSPWGRHWDDRLCGARCSPQGCEAVSRWRRKNHAQSALALPVRFSPLIPPRYPASFTGQTVLRKPLFCLAPPSWTRIELCALPRSLRSGPFWKKLGFGAKAGNYSTRRKEGEGRRSPKKLLNGATA